MIALPICPRCNNPQATMRHGGAEVFKRHTWFLTTNGRGGDGRCPGSLTPVSGVGVGAEVR